MSICFCSHVHLMQQNHCNFNPISFWIKVFDRIVTSVCALNACWWKSLPWCSHSIEVINISFLLNTYDSSCFSPVILVWTFSTLDFILLFSTYKGIVRDVGVSALNLEISLRSSWEHSEWIMSDEFPYFMFTSVPWCNHCKKKWKCFLRDTASLPTIQIVYLNTDIYNLCCNICNSQNLHV